jgi:hypothetical protein
MVSRSRSGERKRKRRRPNIYALLQLCVRQQCQGFILHAKPRPVYVSPVGFPRPNHGGAVRVLDLDPFPRRAGSIRRAQPFRHDAFEADVARLTEDQNTVLCARSARCRGGASPVASPAASCDRPAAVRADHAVQLQEIERVQHRLAEGPAAVQSIEDRDAIRPAHHGSVAADERPPAMQRVISDGGSDTRARHQGRRCQTQSRPRRAEAAIDRWNRRLATGRDMLWSQRSGSRCSQPGSMFAAPRWVTRRTGEPAIERGR